MRIERLVSMANDIHNFFASHPKREHVVAGILDHMTRFWDPRMHRQIIAHLEASDGEGLEDAVKEAVRQLAEKQRQSNAAA